MLNLMDIYKRVGSWNEKRYERTYDHNLALNLLDEEYEEWLEANSPVKKLDALCDEVYVALGNLWKLDIPEEEVADEEVLTLASLIVDNFIRGTGLRPIYIIPSFIDGMRTDPEVPVLLGMHVIITACLTEMKLLGLESEDGLKALEAVCDSNDSKSVKKTDSTAKANDGDKGPYYVGPEARLQAILSAKSDGLN